MIPIVATGRVVSNSKLIPKRISMIPTMIFTLPGDRTYFSLILINILTLVV